MIEISAINKTYNKVHALKDISLSIKKGELFGLIGPDGAGKTSLIRILMTLLLPDSGTASMNGVDVVKSYKQIRQTAGYMPGRFSLYQDLTVEENLEFFATVFGTTIQENYYLIEDIYKQIEPFKNRLAGKLSGGMKQKLALSCALIHCPDILILDEPTTGVDAVSRKEFWEMLRNLQKREMTILVSTPYMDEAGLCDRVALMQNGRLLEVDTPRRITEKFNRLLLSVRSADMHRLISDVRAYEKTDTAFAFGQTLHVTSKDDDMEAVELENYLHSKQHREIHVQEIEPSIEDVFMDRMKS